MLAALAACNPTEDPPPPPKTVPVVAVPEQPPVGVPHGGQITHLAVTEAGDAAVTVDNLGDLRLWPTLDGKHEPIPFTVNGADTLAIAHAGDELLVGVVDQAGAGHLVRFSRTGVQHAKLQLPGDVAIDQIVAIDRGVLVARVDQSIERYDATGVLRGRITADASTTFGALAVRHGVAAVLLSERDTTEDPAPLPLIARAPPESQTSATSRARRRRARECAALDRIRSRARVGPDDRRAEEIDHATRPRHLAEPQPSATCKRWW